ncbi:rhomboid family intramembrane serine protease [Solitalea koreensis]|uniref:Rhomboid-like protein n=1 Tax=Solitalea koreensis TaxID=543615 RepID=A0A521CTW0_9SPHI|nr:rhomboid family intramembrane serine protease [Solitalea koreensis]SMO62161.1 rhomboid-like protein [Solitalea koreensis]
MDQFRPPSMFANLPPVVKNILIVNVLVFFAMINPAIDNLFVLHGAAYYFDSPNFRIWQLITYAFLHGGFMHIFFNMFAVFMFGKIIEEYIGSKRFFSFYMITAIGAILFQMCINAYEVYKLTGSVIPYSQNMNFSDPVLLEKVKMIYSTPTLGASGAVFGILLAFGYLFPDVKLMIIPIPIPIKAKYLVAIYALVELGFGVTNSLSNVAHFAHIGGMIFGFILLKAWNIKRPSSFY